MKMKNMVPLIILLLFIFGCASTQIKAVDQTGREIPMPHYYLKTMDGNFQVLFYWAKHHGVEDLDGTVLSQPTYFDYFRDDFVDPKKVDKVTLTVEVINPKKLRYELWERTIIKDRFGRTISRGELLGYSNQYQRTFVFKLPIDEDIEDVDFGIDFVNQDGQPVVHIGSYTYEVGVKSHKKGGEGFSSVTSK